MWQTAGAGARNECCSCPAANAVGAFICRICKAKSTLNIIGACICCTVILDQTKPYVFFDEPARLRFQISSEWALRSQGELKCRRLGGRLAVLDEAEQFGFVAAIVVRRPRLSVAEHGLWTAARNFKGRSAMYLQWAKGSPRFALTTSSFISDACVDANFYLGRFASVSCNSTLRYVCEKDS